MVNQFAFDDALGVATGDTGGSDPRRRLAIPGPLGEIGYTRDNLTGQAFNPANNPVSEPALRTVLLGLEEQLRAIPRAPTSSTSTSVSGTPFDPIESIPGLSIDRSPQGGGRALFNGQPISNEQLTQLIQLSNPQQAVGLRSTFVDPGTGQIHGVFDDGTTQPLGQGGFPQFSPQQQRQQDLQDTQADRDFALQNFGLGSQFTLNRDRAGQEFEAAQAQLTRAARAGEFAAGFGQSEEERRLSFAQASFNRAQAIAQLQQQSAAQLSNQISNTDPAALPAFLMAGGGNISNAIASGADALSDNALLPAARTLRGIESFAPPPIPQFQPQTFNPGGQGLGNIPQPTVPNFGGFGGFRPPPRPQPPLAGPQGTTLGDALAFANQQNNFNGQGNPRPLPGQGSISELQRMLNAATGQPVIAAADGFSGTVNEPTTFVVGENGPEDVQVNPLVQGGDQPFLDRIRQLRQGVDSSAPIPGGGFNVGFTNVLPSLRERFIKAQQSRFGVPIADQLAEINRFRLPTLDRNQVNFGI